MNIVKFIPILILISIMILEKIFLFGLEPAFSRSFIGRIELTTLLTLFFFGLLGFFRDKKNDKKAEKNKHKNTKIFRLFLILAITVVLGLSFFLNWQKKALDWDAVALYDARAKFLQTGSNFSGMVSLSNYDNKNSYYYLMYPPYTSIAHYFWYQFGFNQPVTLLYSFYLVLFAWGLYSLAQGRLGLTWGLIFVLLIIANKNIFLSSLDGYTNLPFSIYLALGILLLANYLKEKKSWQLFYGIILVATSQWIRFIEPVWIGVVIVYLLLAIKKKNLKWGLTSFLLLVAVCLLEYLSWTHFTNTIAKNPTIFQISVMNIIESLVGIFTGSLIVVFLFFITTMGISFLIHIASLFTCFHSDKKDDCNKDLLFLKGVIIASIFIYFFGLYAISFLADWWKEMGGSLVRSSGLMLPLSAYLILVNIRKIFYRNIDMKTIKYGNALFQKIYNKILK